MCGRFYFEDLSHVDWDSLLQEISDSYKTGEIFPTNQVAIVTALQKPKVITWGFPSFRSPKGTVINARSETVQEKPLFKQVFLESRCVIPTNGFFEWDQHKLNEQNKKQKYLFLEEGQTELFMAGIYREFAGELRFVILTREANDSMQPYHNRMPIILQPEEINDWLTNLSMAQAKLYDEGPDLIATPVV